MKERITLLIAVLIFALSFAGCGGKDAADKDINDLSREIMPK